MEQSQRKMELWKNGQRCNIAGSEGGERDHEPRSVGSL